MLLIEQFICNIFILHYRLSPLYIQMISKFNTIGCQQKNRICIWIIVQYSILKFPERF